jgi:predicted Rossmann fold nucleotide-binding protein DprA/Smf involved in DNA uptake
MNEDAKHIAILCGEFGDDHQPITRAMFWKIFHENDDSIDNVIASGRQEVLALLKRSGSVAFSISKMERMGIKITTVLDDDFPPNLHRVLGDKCPPMLYYCGDSGINRRRYVGYVGSRNVDDTDRAWVERMVAKNTESQYGVVSGGAKGIDMISTGYALSIGNYAIEFLAEGLEKRIKDPTTLHNVLEGRLLQYSATSPLAKGTRYTFTAAAMERNKFIYAQSLGTVVVKSGLEEGGTWAGAKESLKNNWCKVYVWDNKSYPGNQALIERGGIGLDDDGKISIDNSDVLAKKSGNTEVNAKFEQISMFEAQEQENVSESDIDNTDNHNTTSSSD